MSSPYVITYVIFLLKRAGASGIITAVGSQIRVFVVSPVMLLKSLLRYKAGFAFFASISDIRSVNIFYIFFLKFSYRSGSMWRIRWSLKFAPERNASEQYSHYWNKYFHFNYNKTKSHSPYTVWFRDGCSDDHSKFCYQRKLHYSLDVSTEKAFRRCGESICVASFCERRPSSSIGH